MSSLFNHRREMYGLVEPLNDINDIRNGILLNVGFCRLFDLCEVAFLKVCDLLSFLSIPCNSSI